ncbi:MAG: hypothetical protein AB7U20_03965 [Planctomycetaceae bacterium]
MLPIPRRSSLTALLLAGIVMASPTLAVEHAAEFLPPSTVLYAEISDPPGVMDLVTAHPVAARLRTSAAYRQAVEEPKSRKFLTAVKYVESQLGMSWREAFETATQGGVVLAFDARTEAAALLMQAADERKLARITATFVRLAREDAERKGEDTPFEERDYRGVTVYRTKQGGFAAYQHWFVVVNNSDLGRDILDALLDSRERSLADVSSFQEARRTVEPGHAAWVYANIGAVREAGAAPRLFSGRADDPIGELLLGGVLDVLRQTPCVTAALRGDDHQLGFTLSMPLDRSWMTEEREHYFGAEGNGRAPQMYDLPNKLFTLAVHRNVSAMWLRSGDLFDEQVNDKLAEADGKLSTLFAGKDFGEDILGSIAPQLQIVAVRQEFPPDRPVPAIKLPAAALLAELKDPDVTARELRRIFQSLIGFLNVVGAMNGQPQLELDQEPLADGEGELISATFVGEAAAAPEQGAKIQFNFSPSVAFSGNRMIIASTAALARDLAALNAVESPVGGDIVNLQVGLSADVLRMVLGDNLTHLISQNMLEKGHTRDEATAELETLLNILSLVGDVAMTLSTSGRSLDVTIDVHFAEQAGAP